MDSDRGTAVGGITVTPASPSLAALHWHRYLPQPVSDPALAPAHADVVIVGGGYMGAATALWLARSSVPSVVVERRATATGATGRNAGFIAPGLGQNFADAVERYGRAGAIERLDFTRRGRDLALATIVDLGIDCELETPGGLTVASSPEEWERLGAAGRGLRDAGAPVETLSRAELSAHIACEIPARFAGALFNPETALVNPARLARGVMAAAERLGARVLPHTEVTALCETGAGRWSVETSRGTIAALRVVIATNAWSPALLGFFRHRIAPVRGQMLATAPTPRVFHRAMSTNWGYEYWSQRAGGEIILGGARWATPDRDQGYLAEETNPDIQDALLRFLVEGFPALTGVLVERRWAGIMGFSPDGYPFIGPVPGRPGLYALAGFTGHGGPYSLTAGRAVAELIARGRTDEPIHHFALDRPLPGVPA